MTPISLSTQPVISELSRPPVLADVVYDALRQLLTTGGIEPGSRIKIDVIAKQMGVSNSPIRQALGRLEADGLVLQEPHRGFMAAEILDERTVSEIYAVRSLLEPPAAGNAARMRSKDDIDRLRNILMTPDEQGGFMPADREFHLTVASVAGNSIVVDLLERLFLRSHVLRTMYVLPRANEITHDEHEVVLAAIADGDEAGAQAAMLDHLAHAIARMNLVAQGKRIE